jgi:hypothetical protein
MPKSVTSLRNAIIAAASLSLLMVSAAQADQQAEGTPAATINPKKHVVPTYHPKRKESQIRPKTYGAAPNLARCAWPYQNMFPPCMSTFPQGDPNYHGSRPGVTFE